MQGRTYSYCKTTPYLNKHQQPIQIRKLQRLAIEINKRLENVTKIDDAQKLPSPWKRTLKKYPSSKSNFATLHINYLLC